MQNNRCFTKKILTVILITFISVTSFGQSYIKGVIKDSLGKKLSLVSVSLIVKQTETGIDFVLTNEGGEYFFTNRTVLLPSARSTKVVIYVF